MRLQKVSWVLQELTTMSKAQKSVHNTEWNWSIATSITPIGQFYSSIANCVWCISWLKGFTYSSEGLSSTILALPLLWLVKRGRLAFSLAVKILEICRSNVTLNNLWVTVRGLNRHKFLFLVMAGWQSFGSVTFCYGLSYWQTASKNYFEPWHGSSICTTNQLATRVKSRERVCQSYTASLSFAYLSTSWMNVCNWRCDLQVIWHPATPTNYIAFPPGVLCVVHKQLPGCTVANT